MLKHFMKPDSQPERLISRTGTWSSLFLAFITLVTFGFAVTAIPIAGPFCPGDCIEYPYLDQLGQYPKDFIWMFLALPLLVAYLVFMACIHQMATGGARLFSRVGFSLAVISTAVLLVDYYVQSFVVPVSLMHGETEGIPILTQYNGHGIFIALEELGYLAMSLSFLFMAPAFAGKGRLGSFIQWIFIIAFLLTIASLVIFLIQYGMEREYRFEVAVITIDWLVLVINGILVGLFFKRISTPASP